MHHDTTALDEHVGLGDQGAPDARDATHDLADVLGWDASVFAQTFGAGWRESSEPPAHDFDADPSGGLGADVTPWHVAGDPPQLMVRVFRHGVFVATPEGAWRDHGTLVHHPRDETYLRADLDREHVVRAVHDLLRRRRSSFRYCRYCRDVTAPERLVGAACMGCATDWEGVVY